MIWHELKEKEVACLNTASFREKLFYSYLKKELSELEIDNLLNASDQNRFCAHVFNGTQDQEVRQLYQNILKSEQKGMSYGSNLLMLCAMSLYNYDEQKETLKIYFENASVKEKFIIREVFSDLNRSSLFEDISGRIVDDVDRLVDAYLVKSQDSLPPDDFVVLVGQTNDVIDLYVLEKIYRKKAFSMPEVIGEEETKIIQKSVPKLIGFIDKSVLIAIVLLMTSVFYYPMKILGELVINQWDKIEPIAWLVPIILAIFFFAIMFVFGNIIPNKVTTLGNIRSYTIRKIYIVFLKINRDKLLGAIKKKL